MLFPLIDETDAEHLKREHETGGLFEVFVGEIVSEIAQSLGINEKELEKPVPEEKQGNLF
jgi:hypothetical protein